MEPVTGMAAILQNVGSVVTAAIGWMGSFISSITTSGNEILLLFIIVPLVLLGVNILRRMLSL